MVSPRSIQKGPHVGEAPLSGYHNPSTWASLCVGQRKDLWDWGGQATQGPRAFSLGLNHAFAMHRLGALGILAWKMGHCMFP